MVVIDARADLGRECALVQRPRRGETLVAGETDAYGNHVEHDGDNGGYLRPECVNICSSLSRKRITNHVEDDVDAVRFAHECYQSRGDRERVYRAGLDHDTKDGRQRVVGARKSRALLLDLPDAICKQASRCPSAVGAAA